VAPATPFPFKKVQLVLVWLNDEGARAVIGSDHQPRIARGIQFKTDGNDSSAAVDVLEGAWLRLTPHALPGMHQEGAGPINFD
jgi:hypothetical protein